MNVHPYCNFALETIITVSLYIYLFYLQYIHETVLRLEHWTLKDSSQDRVLDNRYAQRHGQLVQQTQGVRVLGDR